MRFEDEQYIRLYRRDTTTWLMLNWQGRCILPLIFRKLDRAGLLDLGDDGFEALAAHIQVPLEVVEEGMASILRRKALVLREDGLLMSPRFIEAQEAKQSDKARQKAARDRARDLASAAGRGVSAETSFAGTAAKIASRVGGVYFVEAEGKIKIGHSVDVGERLRAIRTSHPHATLLGTIPGSEPEERELHDRFAPERVAGEWFSPSEALRAFIRTSVTRRDVDDPDLVTNVTPRDVDVTRGHTASQSVTLSCAEPSCAEQKDRSFRRHPEPEQGGQQKLLSETPPEIAVFDHWIDGWKREIGGTRPPGPNDKRLGKIRARLAEGFTVDELKLAVDGMWSNDFNVQNHHTDIELVCRDDAHVRRYMAIAEEAFPARKRFPNLPAFVPPEDNEPLAAADDYAAVESLMGGIGR